jgi:hypothetical protein
MAAKDGGADWVVLCDTNGGTMPHEVAEITEVVMKEIGVPVGIHTHDDTGVAVGNALASILAGATQVQGTVNGYGERVGNCNLTTIIPTLLLKEPFVSQFETGVTLDALKGLRKLSRSLDDILNRVPQKQAPYVGSSAFAHKAGLHASAIAKDPTTYEHIDPATVGNSRIVPMSNQAGQSNLRERLIQAGLAVEKGDPALARILDRIKDMEARGYSYDTAQASFELLARVELGLMPTFFEVKRYRVSVERRRNKRNQMVSLSEAVVVVKVNGKKMLNVSESQGPDGKDGGPVNALWRALAKDLHLKAARCCRRCEEFSLRIGHFTQVELDRIRCAGFAIQRRGDIKIRTGVQQCCNMVVIAQSIPNAARQFGQLRTDNCRRQIGHAQVIKWQLVLPMGDRGCGDRVFRPSVFIGPRHDDRTCHEVCVIGDKDATFARVNHLVALEAKAPDPANRADLAPVPCGAKAVGGVFYHRNVCGGTQVHDCVHVGCVTAHVRYQDRVHVR